MLQPDATATSLPRDQTAAYRHQADDVLAALGTDAERGLSQAEARARLERYGRNELAAETPVPAWRKFLAQFQDVLVILLLIATAISAGLWLYERDSALPYEAMAIFAVVLLNAVMGYVQESRAESAVAALRQMSAAHAHVIRDGSSGSVAGVGARARRHHPRRGRRHHPGRRAADRVHGAADGRGGADRREPPGREGHRVPSAKRPALGDRHNMVFSGTTADLRPRAGGRRGDGHADRDGPHRRDAEGGAAPRRRRYRRSSARVGQAARRSSSSSSPS